MKYTVFVEFWFYGNMNPSELVKEYDAESADKAKEMFRDEYPPMLGTCSFRKVVPSDEIH